MDLQNAQSLKFQAEVSHNIKSDKAKCLLLRGQILNVGLGAQLLQTSSETLNFRSELIQQFQNLYTNFFHGERILPRITWR